MYSNACTKQRFATSMTCENAWYKHGLTLTRTLSTLRWTIDVRPSEIMCTCLYRGGHFEHMLWKTPFTRYNRLLNRLYNRIDNRLYRVNKHPTGCQTGCQAGLTTGLTTVLNEQPLFVQPVVKPGCTTGLTTGCIHDSAVCQTGCQTGLTNGWMFVYTIQPVVKPVWQQVVSCKRG